MFDKNYTMSNIKREKIIFIRVTDDEYQKIKAKAMQMGLRISTYLRMMAVKTK